LDWKVALYFFLLNSWWS